MFRLNFKIALRNLWKNKGYTFINIAGLAVGMASCILIFIFVSYQLSFDQQFEKKDRIFRVVTNWTDQNGEGATKGVPLPMAGTLREEFPQLEKVAAIQSSGGQITVPDAMGKVIYKDDAQVFYAEPDFFEVLDFSWLTTKPVAALKKPNTVVLSEEKAKLYFGSWQQAVGKTLHFKNKPDLTVAGVFKDNPENSSFPLNVVVSYASYKNSRNKSWTYIGSSSECYFLLKEGVRISDVEAQMEKLNHRIYKNLPKGNIQYFHIQPLEDIHQNAAYGNFAHKIMEKSQLYGLVFIGAFLMLTACINFINLATAQAVSRSKEVGVRKVMGSRKGQLVMQFLGETVTVSMIALLIACVIAEVALPHMENLFNEKISFNLFSNPVIFLFLAGLVLIVSFFAGFYPALVMSGFSPALAIKNKVSPQTAGGLGLRKILVVLQFTITIILVIATIVVLKQMTYMRNKPLGFNPEAVASISLPADSLSRQKYTHFKERLLQLPGVQNASYFDVPPSSENVSETNFSLNGIKVEQYQVRTMFADAQYFDTFGLQLVAGKVLPKSDTTNAYIVNQTFLRRTAIKHPEEALGKMLTVHGITAPIVGVVKDFNDKSLHEEISPIAISSSNIEYYRMAVKMDSKAMLPAMKEVAKIWNSTFPDDVYEAHFVNDDINDYYETEKVMGVLFKVFSFVIIFISLTGLFGLISFVAAQRTREVAIRKVLGASDFELVSLLNGSFLLMVFIANIAAWPLAYIFADKWLSSFAYRIDLSIWPFIIAMAASMIVTFFTVSIRSYKSARTNPVDALKYE
jgi:putative ABC transport system permease protein